MRKFFEINGSQDIELSVNFRFRKIAVHHKIINKTQSAKNHENSAHHFGANYLTNLLVKLLQESIKL